MAIFLFIVWLIFACYVIEVILDWFGLENRLNCGKIESMRLARRFDQALGVISAVSILIVVAVLVNVFVQNTFAEDNNPDGVTQVQEAKFVTFYDDGEKLIVKTDAPTVREAIERVDIILNEGDIVEPGLDEPINMDNFFINIHRARPVVVKDGMLTRYLMTASRDIREIAKEAGLVFFDGDEVEISTNPNFLETGVAIEYKIIRNGGRTVTEEEEIAYPERTVKDYNLEPGQQEVRELGEVGLKKMTYKVNYVDNKEVSRELIGEEVLKEPKERVVAVGASKIEMSPLTASKGAQIYTYTKQNGATVQRKETYYDLDMHTVMYNCGGGGFYQVREDGVKVDKDGYVIIAAHLGNYPRCSVVETSLGEGKVYDTGGFAESNAEQFDIATDWTNRNGI